MSDNFTTRFIKELLEEIPSGSELDDSDDSEIDPLWKTDKCSNKRDLTLFLPSSEGSDSDNNEVLVNEGPSNILNSSPPYNVCIPSKTYSRLNNFSGNCDISLPILPEDLICNTPTISPNSIINYVNNELPTPPHLDIPVTSIDETLNLGISPEPQHTLVITDVTPGPSTSSINKKTPSIDTPASICDVISTPILRTRNKKRKSTNEHITKNNKVIKPQHPDFVWNQTSINPTIVPNFESNSGISEDVKNLPNQSPAALFTLYFHKDLIEHIVFHTNLYATQQHANKRFDPVTADEIYLFIAINIYMGMKTLPSYRDYWSSAPDFHDSYICDLMTVNRFGWILSHIHFNDNTLQPKRQDDNYDRLYKIRPVIDSLSQSYKKYYSPKQKLVVDESMVKFKGRSSLKQYIKNKPIKRGFKIWMLCDETGYNLSFQIYSGKQTDSVEVGLGSRVVLDLCKDFVNKNHLLFVDNFFTSPLLFIKLKQQNIFACGTVNPNRKHMPKLVDDKQLEKGSYDWKHCKEGVTVFKWKDNKCVHLMSTYHDASSNDTVKRKQKDGTVTNIPCPTILKDYNINMNFVDNFDRLKGDYALDRKSKKWYARIFFHFIDASLTNAFIINKIIGKTDTNKDFRRQVYQELMAKRIVEVRSKTLKLSPATTSVEIRAHKPHVDMNIRQQSASHLPLHSTMKRCARCSTKQKPVRSTWTCSTCNVALCLGKDKNCFQVFHNM